MRHRIRISGRINKCQILWLSFFFFSGVSKLNFLNRICLPTDRNGQRIPALDWYVLFSYLTSRQGGDSAGAEDTVSLSEALIPGHLLDLASASTLCLLVLIYMDPSQRLLEPNDCPCLLETFLKRIETLETCAPTHPGVQAPCEGFQARHDVCLLVGNYSSPPKLC